MAEPDGSAPATPRRASELLVRGVPVAIYVVVPSLLILGALRTGEFLFGVDVVGGSYYLRGAIGKALASGRLPIWDPHVMAGFPVLASGWSALFYPPSWLSALLSPGTFWTATALLHMVLAGVFAHRWLERGLGLDPWSALGGAFVAMMSGYFVTHLHAGHMNIVWSYPWIPALLWRLERYFAAPTLRRGVLLAAVTALLCLAGVPQYVYFAGWLAAAKALQFVLSGPEERKSRIRIAGGGGAWLLLGLLVTGPQLLPMLELVGRGQRVSLDNYEFVTSNSASPSILLTFLAPTFFGDNRAVTLWAHGFNLETSAFLGVSALALAALGLTGRHRQRYLWATVAGVALVVSMGRWTPLFRLFYHGVPGISLFRVPPRYLLLFTVAMAALVAMGIERLRRGDDRLRRDLAGIAGVAGALVLVAGGFLLSLGSADEAAPGWWTSLVERERVALKAEQNVEGSSAPEAERSRRALASSSLLWMLLGSSAVAALLLARRSRLNGTACAAGLGVVLVLELWIYDARYFRGHPVEDMEWPAEFVSNVRNHPQYPFRIATVTMEQTPAIGKCQLAGIDHVGGYDPMMLRRYTELCNVARGKRANDVVVAMVYVRPSPVFDLLGARYWIVPGDRQEPPGWKTIGQLPSGFVYENPGALPRAFLVGRTVVIDSPEERLKVLADPAFDPRRVAVLESPGSALTEGPEVAKGTLQLTEMKEGRYELKSECSDEAYLVLSESFYPGWAAEVDGAAAPIVPADHLLQAVRLSPGRHDVRFTYRSRFLGLGFALAGVSVLIPLAVFVLRKKRA